MSGRRGIIRFNVRGWSDATGRFDLWNGSAVRFSAHFNRESSARGVAVEMSGLMSWRHRVYELRLPALLLVLLVALLVACGGRETEDVGPPVKLVLANLEETDETVALEVVEARRVEETGDYVSWRIVAEVIKRYKGTLAPGDRIEYQRTVERGTVEPEVGSRHIVSFVHEDGELRIPDVGYHFRYSDALDAALSRAR